ncbi:transmembrane protein, putative [Medicago truncatula]|uniref:Transmembrane protein, putative n=1 Tax=Medicago truncatula TaxID=3880 RepID=G7JPF7_MEDTR|nr:transmembrane protein, putative [Medicago truncatula]
MMKGFSPCPEFFKDWRFMVFFSLTSALSFYSSPFMWLLFFLYLSLVRGHTLTHTHT